MNKTLNFLRKHRLPVMEALVLDYIVDHGKARQSDMIDHFQDVSPTQMSQLMRNLEWKGFVLNKPCFCKRANRVVPLYELSTAGTRLVADLPQDIEHP